RVIPVLDEPGEIEGGLRSWSPVLHSGSGGQLNRVVRLLEGEPQVEISIEAAQELSLHRRHAHDLGQLQGDIPQDQSAALSQLQRTVELASRGQAYFHDGG